MPDERNLWHREGVWWLRTVVNGRKYRESLHTRDVKVARARRDKRIEEIKAARFHGETSIPWKEAVAAWAEASGDNYSPTTARRYAVSLGQVEPFFAKHAINQINGRALADLGEARKRSGASAATIRRDLTAISRVLEYAEAKGQREGNPTLSYRRTVKERRDPIVLPDRASIDMVLAEASPNFRAFIRAAELTGARQNELATAKWRDFAPSSGKLEIIGKGSKRRTIQLSAAAWTHFRTHPRTLNSESIFCREDGEPFSQAASDFGHLSRTVVAKAKKNGVAFRRFRFHDLRHLYAVEALRGGIGIYELSKHLGHTSVLTTEIYLDFLTPEEAERSKDGEIKRTQNRTRTTAVQNASS